jgi:hypothetical protein
VRRYGESDKVFSEAIFDFALSPVDRQALSAEAEVMPLWKEVKASQLRPLSGSPVFGERRKLLYGHTGALFAPADHRVGFAIGQIQGEEELPASGQAHERMPLASLQYLW